MRTSKIYLILFSLLAFLWACEKDGEMIVVKGLKESNLSIDKDNIVLSLSSQNEVVLSFSWDESKLELSDESSKLPNSLVKVIIEVSNNEDFIESTEIIPKSNPHNITGLALNTLAIKLGLIPNESATLYFRTKTSLGNNGEAKVSDVISVNITPFGVDLTKAKILNKDKEDTDLILYSKNSDGIYSGFMSVTAWYNWFLQEADGKIWGNIGVDGKAFVVDDDAETIWNMWFPGTGGVYLTTLDTKNKEWTANHIENMTLSGDVEGDMAFVKAENSWVLSFTTNKDNAKFKIQSTTKLYNIASSTEYDDAVEGKIVILPNSNNTFEYSLDADATEFTAGVAGEYTIKLFVEDPSNLHYELTSGSVVIEDPISELLYAIGVDDGITDSDWNFDNYIYLVSDVDSTYAGVLNINSKWGFQFSLEEGDWDNVYKLGDEEGKLEFKSETNIPAPTPGVYIVEVDLKNLTYSLTEVADQIYVTGLNDVYDFTSVVLSKIENGVYEGTATINAPSPWGIQIHLDSSWNSFFGGSFDSLVWKGQNITDDQSLEVGNYVVKVDLINNNCSFTKVE